MNPGLLLPAVFLFAAPLQAAFAQTSDDFSVSGALVQRVPLDGAKRIVLRCRCPQRTTQAAKDADAVVLDIAATYNSVGYHGKQEKPRRIEDAQMQFVARRDGDTLVLDSRERTMMHHAFLITRLSIAVPDGVEIRTETIPPGALEGRRVDEDR